MSTPANTARVSFRSTPLRCGLLVVAAFTQFAAARVHAAQPLGQLDLELTTTRGCLETGEHPVYALGESITVSFRINSDTLPRASATLFDILPNGHVGVISFGQMSTNRTRTFAARIAPPTGVEQLQLKASAPGAQTKRRSCSFVVAGGSTPTPTKTPDMTPTLTPTPSPLGSATMTPQSGLSAHVRTNRGCIESGDDPQFAIGESILIALRIDSANRSAAQASILDIRGNGFATSFSFGFVRTNVTYQFRGRVGSPTGVHILQLRGRAFGLRTAIDTCSFTVVHTPPATATRSPVPSNSATPTATDTPTPTPTPTPP